jgi:hypothetical protein
MPATGTLHADLRVILRTSDRVVKRQATLVTTVTLDTVVTFVTKVTMVNTRYLGK